MLGIQLIGVGCVKGVYAKDLQPGMRIMWNYGAISDVVEVHEKSRCYMEITHTDGGRKYTRKLKKDRVVAGYWPKEGVQK